MRTKVRATRLGDSAPCDKGEAIHWLDAIT